MPSTSLLTRIEPCGPLGLRVRVHLDEGEPFEVALEALELSRLSVGDALSPQALRRLREADADVRVREAALDLLGRRARTADELRRKLRRKGFAAKRVDECLERLEDKGLLNDSAVAAAFVRDRLRHRPRGRTRLASELRAKGVASDLAFATIEQVFEDDDVSEESLAKEAAEAWVARQGQRTLGSLAAAMATPEYRKARRRLYGYLARRGFRGETLGVAIEHAERVAAAAPRR